MKPPGPLRAAAFIARHDVLTMLRQRETLLWVFLMPIVFFYFIGTMTAGTSNADQPDPIALWAPADSGFLLQELIARLEQQDFTVHRVQTPEMLQQYRRRLRVPEPPAGFASFTDAVLAGQQVTIRFGRSGQGAELQWDRVRVGRAVYSLLADLVVVKAEPNPGSAPSDDDTAVPITREALQQVATAPRSLTLIVRPAGKRVQPPSGYEQAIPGTTVMFTMLVMLTSSAVLLVIERNQGLLRRLACTPLSRAAIVLGKLGGRLVLGIVQIGFGVIAGTILFDMRWGGALPMVALVLAAWALFTAALGLLLGNLARSEGQMVGMGVTGTMVLAALGGCWWPIEITPDWMQSLAMVLPTGWTMDALHRLVSFGYGPASAAGHVAALLAASSLLIWAGVRTFRFE